MEQQSTKVIKDVIKNNPGPKNTRLFKICRNFNVQSCCETANTDHELQLCITENKLNTILKEKLIITPKFHFGCDQFTLRRKNKL